MAKYDVESLLDDVKALLEANFATKIAAINSEKNDSITLTAPASGSYFRGELNGEQETMDPFVFYGIETVKTEGRGPATSNLYSLFVVIVIEDTGQDAQLGGVYNRMLRYMRAMYEVFQDHWSEYEPSVKLLVSSIEPVLFTDLNTTQTYRSAGVKIEASLLN